MVSALNRIKLAESCGVSIYLSDCFEYISLFNSPYYAHNHGVAVDIYPGPGKFGAEALCPSPGRVVDIRKVKAPIRKNFSAEETDYLTLLESAENPNYLIKILHVYPTASIGEELEAGDCLGNLIRSGFFNFWTDPHIHLEVRNPWDAIRARGSHPIRLPRIEKVEYSEPDNSFKCTVIDVRTDYTLVEPDRRMIIRTGMFSGFVTRMNGEPGLLDCGLPHYGFGGVLLKNGSNPGQKAFVGDLHIGDVAERQGNLAAIRLKPLRVCCEEVDLRGLSLYICLKQPIVKLIPNRRERLNLSEGEEILVTIKPKEEE